MSDSSDEGESYSPWSYSSEERAATPVMSECTAAMVLMNLSHAQQNSQQQQRMMQFSDHSTQNSPQGKNLATKSAPAGRPFWGCQTLNLGHKLFANNTYANTLFIYAKLCSQNYFKHDMGLHKTLD